jgi:hypothetical protein
MSLKDQVIEHWEENLSRVRNKQLPNIGAKECAYCQEYDYPSPSIKCWGCPIQNATGMPLCRATPYPCVSKLTEEIFMNDGEAHRETWPALIRAVEEELEFLRSLPDDSEA